MHPLEFPPINRAVATFMQKGAGRITTAPAAFATAFADVVPAPTPLTIPTRHGDVATTVFRPSTDDARPALYLNFHGGGYVIRVPEQDDLLCAYLADHAGVVVVNVDYSVAPQAQFPIAIQEAIDILTWVVEHAHEQGWDATRIVVGGQSAGGAIATALARSARDSGGPAIALQVLTFPPLDLVTPAAEKVVPGVKHLLTPTLAHIFDGAYAPADRRSDPLVSPAAPANLETIDGRHPLAGMPTTLLITAERDLLRAEGIRYAAGLREAGVTVTHEDVAGVDHGFLLAEPASMARQAMDLMVAEVRSAVG